MRRRQQGATQPINIADADDFHHGNLNVHTHHHHNHDDDDVDVDYDHNVNIDDDIDDNDNDHYNSLQLNDTFHNLTGVG